MSVQPRQGSGNKNKTEQHADKAIRGLSDQQILGMIRVLSGQLLDYSHEWERRVRELADEIHAADGGHGGP